MLLEKRSGNTPRGKHMEYWCIYKYNLEKGWRNQAKSNLDGSDEGLPQEIFKDKY